jgi:hypothetical protein
VPADESTHQGARNLTSAFFSGVITASSKFAMVPSIAEAAEKSAKRASMMVLSIVDTVLKRGECILREAGYDGCFFICI